MGDPDVKVCTAANVVEAEIVRGLLEANGIPAMVMDETIALVMDGMVTGNLGIDVHVPKSALAEAERVIREAREAGSAADEELGPDEES